MSKNSINKALSDFLFFQIAVEVNVLDAYSGLLTKSVINKIDGNKTVWVKNKDSIITPDNWHDKKDIFFKQRFEKYKDSYTLNEKIKQELKALNNLPISSADYEILADRYKKYLTNKTIQETETKTSDAIEKKLYPEIFKDNAFEIWQSMFDIFKITKSSYSTDIDFMFEVMKYNNLIHDNIGLTDIKNWINKVHEISFDKIRYTNPKSNANKTRLAIYNEIISK